jgi:hypothetical protein
MNPINKPNPGKPLHITMSDKSENGIFDPQHYFDEMVTLLNALPCIYDCHLHHVMVATSQVQLIVTPSLDNLQEALTFITSNFSDFATCPEIASRLLEFHTPAILVIHDEAQLKRSIRKLYQMPLRAKMVERLEDYRFSSLPFYLGSGNPGLMLTLDSYTRGLFNSGIEGLFTWRLKITGDQSHSKNKPISFVPPRSLSRNLIVNFA